MEVGSKVYIGSIHAAFNQDALTSLGITHVSIICSTGNHPLFITDDTLSISPDSERIPATTDISETIHISLSRC